MPCSSTLLNETAERIAMRRTDSHSCIVIACEAQRAKLARRIKADVKPVPHETAVQLLDPLTRVEDGLVEFLLATAACKQSVEAEVPRREDFNCDPPSTGHSRVQFGETLAVLKKVNVSICPRADAATLVPRRLWRCASARPGAENDCLLRRRSLGVWRLAELVPLQRRSDDLAEQQHIDAKVLGDCWPRTRRHPLAQIAETLVLNPSTADQSQRRTLPNRNAYASFPEEQQPM